MGEHALLSPSAASRWLTCTPSARLEATFPDSSGEAAAEGTLAHSLGELMISYKLNRINRNPYLRKLKEIQDAPLYDNSMLEHCDNYATFVVESFAAAQSVNSDAQLFLETKLDLTRYVPDGFGTGDVIIICDGTMQIIDLKYGKGVPVSAERNKQMMLYALGAYEEHSMLFDIHQVKMTIFQPRLDSISSYELSVALLENWAATELIPRAKEAFEGTGQFVAGDHCRFCKAKGFCKVNADHNLELAKYDFRQSPLLSEQEIADILDRADQFKKWLTAVEDQALFDVVNNGKVIPGYKLVEGRSNRVFSDENKVAEVLVENMWDETLIYKKKLIGIGDMEKLLSKPIFIKLVGPYIIKPPGKPALVVESDKRPAFNSAEAAALDFAEVLDN